LRDLCPTSKPTQADLADAAERLSGQIGVSWRAWSQACAVMGRFEAGVAIIVMAARVGRGEVIRFRDAYFRALVDRSARHTLFLDRSLYALRDIHAAESGALAETRPQ
ncbi:replication initiation protein RepC, partial [Acetobacter garciniae]